MKRKSHFWLRLVSVFIDISAIYCITSLCQVLIYYFTFITFGNILIGVFIGYYFLSYILLEGRTLAKIFTGLCIVRINGDKANPSALFKREFIFKGVLGIILPLYCFENLKSETHFLLIIIEMMLIVIISALFLLTFKQTWWEWMSKTATIKNKNVSANLPKYTILSFAILYISSISFAIYPLLINQNNITAKYPISHPNTREIELYADYIRNHSQDPVDYIFDLFNKFDIVVISERMHPEYSQYEFIFKVINDKRFSDRIGNIFTECGSVSYQDSLENYFNTCYQTEEELNRATARLARNNNAIWPLWDNTNLFDMFKTVHTLNWTLPDSSKIKWYFTDLPVNWETATHETFLQNYTNPNRDSLMAVQVIDKYNKKLSGQKQSKALVIMNSYHGYGLAPNGRNYFSSTTGYIMKALPGKVSNVMINTISMKYLWAFVPIQNGKWDAAFELAGEPYVGFTFTGSPFGDDHFDARYLQVRGLTYKDVFTGFIFYSPISEQFSKNGFPFEFENSEDKLIKRGAVVDQQYVEMINRVIKYQKSHPANPYDTGPTKIPFIYNLIFGVGVPFLLFLYLLFILIFYLAKRKQINNQPQ